MDNINTLLTNRCNIRPRDIGSPRRNVRFTSRIYGLDGLEEISLSNMFVQINMTKRRISTIIFRRLIRLNNDFIRIFKSLKGIFRSSNFGLISFILLASSTGSRISKRRKIKGSLGTTFRSTLDLRTICFRGLLRGETEMIITTIIIYIRYCLYFYR